MKLSEYIAAGLVIAALAEKMIRDVEQRRAAGQTGYVRYLKNGVGEPIAEPQLPHQTSASWLDSFIVDLRAGKTPEEAVVDAIERFLAVNKSQP